MGDENQLRINIEVPFPSARLAEVAYHVLRVDGEPKRSGVTKQLTLKDNVLEANFTGAVVKQLRVAVNSFLDNISLIAETVEFAGNPVSDAYSHFL